MKNINKVVLITGCSSGIGFETALIFARNGYITFASVRNIKSDGAIQLQEIARKENLQLETIEIDVTSDNSTVKGAQVVLKQTERIDVLVNNAGFGFLGPIEEFSVEEIKQQYDTNIFGMIRMVKEVVPAMRKQKTGMIINMSSINGLIPFPLWGVYSSSKFAVETLTETLRFEVAPFNIKVVMVEPGSFVTHFDKNITHPKSMKDSNSPYKKITTSFFAHYDKAVYKVKSSWMLKLASPKKIANKIFYLSQQTNPKLRNKVGIDAHVFYFLKSILPDTVWNSILRKVYNW